MKTIYSTTNATSRELPEGLSEESASYALDGPREQRIARLQKIIRDCAEWGTTEAKDLHAEASEYLAEIIDAQ